MGGPNAAERLKQSGIDAAKGTAVLVDPSDLFLAPEGHPLHDPRSLWPVDQSLVAAINSGTVRPTVVVRDDGIPKGAKVRRLTVIDGSRRSKATIEINRTTKEGRKVEVQIVSGDDKEMLLLRLQLNGQRRDETPTTLAYKFKQGEKAGLTLDEMCRAYGCTRLVAMQVQRFPQCAANVRAAFDSGELPIEVLGNFVDVPPEEQAAFFSKVKAALPPGVTASAAAGGKVSVEAARKAVLATKRAEGRKKTVKRLKSLPSVQLLAMAKSLDSHSNEAVVIAFEYAAGKPDRMKVEHPKLFEKLEAIRKGKAK